MRKNDFLTGCKLINLKMNTFYKYTIIVAVFVSAIIGVSLAQVSPHFSQYYAYPMWLNPGLTGVMDGDYRVTAIYRNQWASVTTPFSTPGISADIRANENIGLGINVMNQTAGTAGYNYLNSYASMSFMGVKFGPQGNHRISLGVSGGIISRRFDVTKFQTGEQWNPATGFDPSVVNTDLPVNSSGTAFDAGAGVLYYDATPGRKVNAYGGFSAFHLTRPGGPYISGSADSKLPIRYTAHAGARIVVSPVFNIIPNALYMRQAQADETMLGVYGQLAVSSNTDFMLGLNYRLNDAVAPYVGIYYKSFTLGINYDVNTSGLGKAAGNANSFEFSLTITGRRKTKFEPEPFVCPRL